MSKNKLTFVVEIAADDEVQKQELFHLVDKYKLVYQGNIEEYELVQEYNVIMGAG